MAKKKRTPKFEQFTDGRTEEYSPPKYVVQPPVNDKGWEMFSAAFNKQKPYFKPGIKSSNQELKDHDYK
jgi:hypothetical protein